MHAQYGVCDCFVLPDKDARISKVLISDLWCSGAISRVSILFLGCSARISKVLISLWCSGSISRVLAHFSRVGCSYLQ